MDTLNFKKICLYFTFNLLAVFSIVYSNSKALAVSTDNIPKAFFFSKNLKIGDTNEDVMVLQKVLNSNPETEVSSYGAGSSGNETIFFGRLTKNAVVRFQEFYTSDILSPLRLSKGTGFVGIATRLKLNSLIETGKLENQSSSEVKSLSSSSSAEFESQSSSSDSQPISRSASSENSSFSSSATSSEKAFSKSGFEAPGVRVYGTSEYQIKPGSTLSVIGEGFAPTANIAHIGDSRLVKDIKTDSSSSLSFTVPQDLSTGKYSIWVTNGNGNSKNENIKIYIVVTDNPAERPVVEKVEPAEAAFDSEITVSGKGFTVRGNGIYSMFGNVMNISSSDGKTLRFKVSSMQQIAKMQAEKSAKNMPIEVWFYVVNDNGYNKEPASFIIKL